MGVKETLRERGLKPKKKFGQNFLQNPQILNEIADFAEINADDVVLEIGPGMGTLTKTIAQRAAQTVAIEIDHDLYDYLTETFSDDERIHLFLGDALKMDLDQLMEETTGAKHYHMIANLPYYITTPLILHSLCDNTQSERLVIMVQKEVADRLCAQPGSKAYGAISVAVQYRAQVTEKMVLGAGAFYPPPKVDSAVLLLERYAEKPHTAQSDDFFEKTVRQAFAQRRKTVRNSLAAGFPKDAVDEALKNAGIDGGLRAEALSVADFVALSDALMTATASF